MFYKYLQVILFFTVILQAAPKLFEGYGGMIESFGNDCKSYQKVFQLSTKIKKECKAYNSKMKDAFNYGYKLDSSVKNNNINLDKADKYNNLLHNLEDIKDNILGLIYKEIKKARKENNIEYYKILISSSQIKLYSLDYKFMTTHKDYFVNQPQYIEYEKRQQLKENENKNKNKSAIYIEKDNTLNFNLTLQKMIFSAQNFDDMVKLAKSNHKDHIIVKLTPIVKGDKNETLHQCSTIQTKMIFGKENRIKFSCQLPKNIIMSRIIMSTSLVTDNNESALEQKSTEKRVLRLEKIQKIKESPNAKPPLEELKHEEELEKKKKEIPPKKEKESSTGGKAIGIIDFLLMLFGIFIIYQVYLVLFFGSEKFQAIKRNIREHTRDCNELNEHIEELKSSFVNVSSRDYGDGSIQDNSNYNYKRNEWKNKVSNKQIHNCSSTVCRNAENQPFKYLCKYFDIQKDEDTLSEFEKVLNNFSAAEQGKSLLMKKRSSIVNSISESIPSIILYLSKPRLTKELGFDKVDLSDIYFPVYVFHYISAGGNSSYKVDIVLNVNNLNRFVNYLSKLIKFSKSMAGQRALMTSKLRDKIKARDNYTCKHCGLSVKDEKNLLLEIDHIIPISKGGVTSESNLQTLCWRCNRSKGSKIVQ